MASLSRASDPSKRTRICSVTLRNLYLTAGMLATLTLGSVAEADSTLVMWGSNELGQCDMPADLGSVSSVDAGFAFTVALKPDGTLRAWGYNSYGQCDIPAALAPVEAVSAG